MPPRRRAPPAGTRTELPPLKIVRKIFLLQTAYYASATALILFTTLVYGTGFSLDLVFSWDALRGDTTIGWMLGLVWMLNSFLGVISLLLLVSRSKLIPDFALTIHFIHLLATSFYTHSIPRNLLWWGLQCASAALMTFLGIWACQWRELRPITFGIAGGRSTASSSAPPQPQAEEAEAFLPSSSRGRGRGRNMGEGSGEYEMADMKSVERVV
ncbi:protein SYS1 [Aspergillus clavatus NRRL 1]|uniref:Integral membrane protein S linking to the trans Golgi network-domain-containing protein n=1 Tax=Aspergillus clavatus (strain ATCC 1007 / CBS 513.65 / DSM 816 / NCTC 3887 / NRRL 1 / QM 1276 / 107) TaxID=344612 RepID=A1CK78_ASPCL|nr:uncharacterized protein ACLA_037590 [Aspergillus clavatus NRRL 1]EAW09552.1 conserved hypothetical protein [Aspergillus clavatus NRRL 1]